MTGGKRGGRRRVTCKNFGIDREGRWCCCKICIRSNSGKILVKQWLTHTVLLQDLQPPPLNRNIQTPVKQCSTQVNSQNGRRGCYNISESPQISSKTRTLVDRLDTCQKKLVKTDENWLKNNIAQRLVKVWRKIGQGIEKWTEREREMDTIEGRIVGAVLQIPSSLSVLLSLYSLSRLSHIPFLAPSSALFLSLSLSLSMPHLPSRTHPQASLPLCGGGRGKRKRGGAHHEVP